jgi:hypothetical protein
MWAQPATRGWYGHPRIGSSRDSLAEGAELGLNPGGRWPRAVGARVLQPRPFPRCPEMDLTYTCEGPDVYLADSSRTMTQSPIGLPTMVRIARLHQPCIVVVGSTTALGR